MTHRISMMKPIHLLLLLALAIMVPIIAQDEDTAAVQDEVKPVVQEEDTAVEDESEVVVVPDADSIPDLNLNPGDIAPTWALMYAPAKFEFLKNWTVERGARTAQVQESAQPPCSGRELFCHLVQALHERITFIAESL